MPAKSAKQYRFFQMIANSKTKPKKGIGGLPSKEVAKEMIHKTPKKKRSIFSRDY
jgi:hypothetical protein